MLKHRPLLIIVGVIIWAASAIITFNIGTDTIIGIVSRLIFVIPIFYLMFLWPSPSSDISSDPMLGKKVEVIEEFIEKDGEYIGLVKFGQERWSAVMEQKGKKPNIGDFIEIVHRNGNTIYVKTNKT